MDHLLSGISTNMDTINSPFFFPVKLIGEVNYIEWETQMKCFLELHHMKHTIDPTSSPPETGHLQLKLLDVLAKIWILRSLNEDVAHTVAHLETAKDVWEKLRTAYDFFSWEGFYRFFSPTNSDMHYFGNFVAVELYPHPRLHISNDKVDNRGYTQHTQKNSWKRDELFEEILDKIIINDTLDIIATILSHNIDTSVANDGVEHITHYLNPIIVEMITLDIACHTARNMAQSITQVIARKVGRNIAHKMSKKIALEISSYISNYVTEGTICRRVKSVVYNVAGELVKVIGKIKDNITLFPDIYHEKTAKSLLELVSDTRSNALHHAANAGNTKAARNLVEKDPHLLFTVNNENRLPIHMALLAPHLETFAFLLDASIAHAEKCKQESHVEAIKKLIEDQMEQLERKEELCKKETSRWEQQFVQDDQQVQKDDIERKIESSQHEVLNLRFLMEQLKRQMECLEQHKHHSPFKGIYAAMLLDGVIKAGLMDVAYQLINANPAIVATKYDFVESALKTTVNVFNLYYSQPKESRNLDRDMAKIFQVAEASTEDRTWLCSGNSYDRLRDDENPGSLSLKLAAEPLRVLRFKPCKPLRVLRSICNEVSKRDTNFDKRYHFMEAATIAVTRDVTEALEELTRHFPDAIGVKHEGYLLIELAILHRSNKVYDFLVHEMTRNNLFIKLEPSQDGNNLLHLAGKLAPMEKLDYIDGAAFQMQRELLWFKEVESLVSPMYKEARNQNDETPLALFRKEHYVLKRQGEEWIKMVAYSYTIIDLLVIAIAFGVPVTIPHDMPSASMKTNSFHAFAISDAIVLVASLISMILFSSILISGHTEEDFRYKLPLKLVCGVLTLLASVLVAYGALLYLFLQRGNEQIRNTTLTLASVTFLTFLIVQMRLISRILHSTCGPFTKSKIG